VLEFAILVQMYTTEVPLTPGVTYAFKVQSRNEVGFSPYSEEVKILAAQIPEVPAAPVTVVAGDDVRIDFVEPNDMGAPILGYRIKIKDVDGVSYSYSQDSCQDYDNPTLVETTSCSIPIYMLMEWPFNLPWGSSI
jgi:hypothetical protein